MNKQAAEKWLAEEAINTLSEEDRAKFVEVVEKELGSLHQGNIARYRLRPAEFDAWKASWE